MYGFSYIKPPASASQDEVEYEKEKLEEKSSNDLFF